MIVLVLVAGLALAGGVYGVVLMRASFAAGALWPPRWHAVAMSAVSNFLDTLGVSSFATTLSWMKFSGLTPDRMIPATLVAGYTLPSILQSAIFLILLGVKVDPVLLAGCIAAMVAGGLVGARLVRRAPVRLIQLLVGVALLVAGLFFVLANLHLMPPGGRATGLPPGLMAIAIGAHLVMGVLVNFGVGNYAPTLVMLSLFGMDPRLAFPIMTSAAAFSVAGAATQLVAREPRLDLRVVTGMALGSIPAVLIAAFLVRDMPLSWLRWMVVAVVAYAAFTLFRSALAPAAPPEAIAIPKTA